MLSIIKKSTNYLSFMKNIRNIFILFMLTLLSSCSVVQQREFWFSEDGKYLYKNSTINTATYETFRPLQQYHGKQVKGIKQDGMMISFSLQDATSLNIKVPIFANASVNGVALKSGKYDSAEEEQQKIAATKQAAREQNEVKVQEVPLKKNNAFSKTNHKGQSKKKATKTIDYNWGQYTYKTIEWIVVLEHGVVIKFTDRTKLHIGGNERCTPCINNVKYRFSECY
ncbi:hypothetical protein EZS27_030971 [termite gut metagenome]|uniref:Lipoprotein n=1 Tax=termite gut metagenome TaxID=433724 RepID=A0A5J4QBG4_9ZZZZ